MALQTEVLVRRTRRPTSIRWRAALATRSLAGLAAFAILAGAVLLTGLAIASFPGQVPPLSLATWVVVGGLFLPLRRVLWLDVLVALTVAVVLPRLPLAQPFTIMAVAVLGLLMIMMFVLATSRARLGIVGFTGENLLVDLRDRLASGAEIGPLPEGWRADHAIHSANGEAFSGDFLITALSVDGTRLEVALVDVSGKGREAGSRSLALSGALGGILGSVPAQDFLAAANTYLLRQRWDEGFATAVHVDIDLISGEYSIGNAGHPAPAAFHAGAGWWTMERAAFGPLLGVLPGATYARTQGIMRVDDALMLYSDGVVESPELDLFDGTDRLLGVASRALVSGEGSVAEAACAAAPSGTSDDRAVFVLRRTR